MEEKFSASFEIKEVTANSLPDFIEKVKTMNDEGEKVTNITAIVITATFDP